MDVTCERCSTEYEFDDALVTERGTTVKCTTCGHQFKVRREAGGTLDRWLVRTVDGRELELGALRELQAAIAQARVTRDDVLVRGGSRPRRLGSIAELDPFFASAGGIYVPSIAPGPGPSVPPVGVRSRTPTPAGLGAMPPPGARTEGSVAIPLPMPPPRPSAEQLQATVPRVRRSPSIPPPAPRPLRASVPPPLGPARPSLSSIPPPPLPPPPGVVVAPDAAPPVPEDFIATLPQTPQPPRASVPPPAPLPPAVPAPAAPPPVRAAEPEPPKRASHAPAERASSASDPGAVSSGSRYTALTPAPLTPTPGPSRTSFTDEATFTEPRFSSVAPPATSARRSGGARLMIGILLAGIAAFAGITFGRRYLDASAKPAASAPSDARVTALLAEGEKLLAQGDLESAKEQLDKASALDEKDPHVAADLARLAAVRADFRWLRKRMLPAGAPEAPVAQRELDDAAKRLAQAVDAAAALAPDDPVVVRARMDAKRVVGDDAGARKLAPELASVSAEPETALALAELDLAEEHPSWSAVVDRLRLAAGAEQGLGRARALLVYALARSGDLTTAKSELDHLRAAPRPHPLLAALDAFVAAREKDAAAIDPSTLPDADKDHGAKAHDDKAKPAHDDEHKASDEPKGDDKAAAPSETHHHPSGGGSGDDDRVPDDFVAPQPGAHVDTSDLPGATPPPKAGGDDAPKPAPPAPADTGAEVAPKPAPAPAPAQTIDTSDLPGVTPP